jgi:hypothetical protein
VGVFLNFQANRLVLESGQRIVIEAFSNLPGTRLLLRPARKRLFISEPEISSLSVELNKPAFAVLVDEEDLECRAKIVFETDQVSAGIRELYRNADIPVVESDTAAGRGVLRFERSGFVSRMQFDHRGLEQAVDSILRWSEPVTFDYKGSMRRNPVEQVVGQVMESIASDFGVLVNYHMPFGYVAGYRPDLPRSIARHTIEVTVTMRPSVHPEAPVVLPIRIETEHDSNRTEDSIERDQIVADFVCSVGMPMAAIQPSENDQCRITYSLDGMDDIQLDTNDVDGWRASMSRILEHALNTVRIETEHTDPVGANTN